MICNNIKHTAENLDKWIQVATTCTDSQFYKFIVFDKSTHKFSFCDTRLSVQCLPGLLRSIKLAIQVA